MNSPTILRIGLAACALLVAAIYFIYRPYPWPLGLEALECLISLVILLVSAILLHFFKKKPVVANHHKNLHAGLLIGVLWAVEISINNVLHPPLPYRDIIDNIFWAIIALLIFVVAAMATFRDKKIISGLLAGCWAGYGSGLVACLTALSLIVFAIPLVLSDPLNITEWRDLQQVLHYPNMAVYFAYQTLTGAILHLVLLGAVMGALLGIIGGLVGKGVSYFTKNKSL